MHENIDFLQDAGGRLSSDIFANNPCVLLGLAQQGLDIDHVDIDDMPFDGGMGSATLSHAAGLLSQDNAMGIDSLQDISDLIVDLLEAGADVWPFHIPGISARSPPPESDIQGPVRQQMASVLWPDPVPRFGDRGDYYEGPELAPLIGQAGAFCTGRGESRGAGGASVISAGRCSCATSRRPGAEAPSWELSEREPQSQPKSKSTPIVET